MRALALALALALAGCAAAEGAPQRAPESAAAMPFTIERLSTTFEGRAAEVLQASGYTYVAVALPDGSTRWAVSLRKDLDEGAPVRVRAFGKKERFESKKLGRTFDELWFAIVTQGATS